MNPNLNEEKFLLKNGYKFVAGIDEAGRGPLAGPVVAAAVCLNPNFEFRKSKQCQKSKLSKSKISLENFYFKNYSERSSIYRTRYNLFRISDFVLRNLLESVRDSKQLTPKQRERLYEEITKCPQIDWGVGIVSEKIIDKINILEATKLAMIEAIRDLDTKPDYLILDGKMSLKIDIPQKSIIKGDAKVFSCAAASIIAKVTRDRIMLKMNKKYPQYGFDIHKGYPTEKHLKALKKYGPCKIHRKSFGPVRVRLNAPC